MSRDLIPFATADISALAKSLRAQLATRDTAPSHVEMLNMLARAAGHRNFQHLRAQGPAAAPTLPPEAAPGPASIDQEQLTRVAAVFDAEGRMIRWPSKTSHQELCLWVLWATIPSRQTFTEREINAVIQAKHLFGDHAILRRCLCNSKLLSRTQDGRDYRRIEQVPPPQAMALIRRVLARVELPMIQA